MSWIEFIVHVPKEQAGDMEDYLLAQGALAITLQDLEDQPIYEPDIGTTPLWEQNRITALFEADFNTEKLYQAIQNQYGEAAPSHFISQALEDRDWEREWLKHYQHMQFGENLWVIPSAFEEDDTRESDKHKLPKEIPQNAVKLFMDPGLAFGTGTHETTALCLEWLSDAKLQSKNLIDYGCGSGILAIAAKLLGAEKVKACDLDPQAVLASIENARRNRVQESIEIFDIPSFNQSIEQDDFKADILVANILAGPLEKLCDEFASLTKSGGMIVLSGILQEQLEALTYTYQRHFEDFEIANKNDWCRISAKKKKSQ